MFWLQRLNPEWLLIRNISRFLRLFYFLLLLKVIIWFNVHRQFDCYEIQCSAFFAIKQFKLRNWRISAWSATGVLWQSQLSFSGLKLKLFRISWEQLDPLKYSMTTLQGNSMFSSWEGDASAVHQGVIRCQQCQSALCCQKEARH